jgi:ABC-type phosphate transport system substrate-binding protein
MAINMRSCIKAHVTGIFLFIAVSVVNAEVVAVVSASNPLTELSTAEIVDIFLGKSSRFPDGGVAIPIDQPENSAAREEFYLRYARKSAVEMKMHWSKLIFTGRGQPPRVLQDASAIKALLADNPAAIGYLDRSQVDDTVTVLESRQQ